MRLFHGLLALLLLLPIIVLAPIGQSPVASAAPTQLIVQAPSVNAARAAVVRAGGTVDRALPIINAVAATVAPPAAAALRRQPGVTVYGSAPVFAASPGGETGTAGYTLYPAAATGAHQLHDLKVDGPKAECKNGQVQVRSGQERNDLRGRGVTVAVIDSGLMPFSKSSDWKQRLSDGTLIAENSGRCLIYRDFLPRNAQNGNSGSAANNSVDQHGHGTHVAATIADQREVVLAAGSNATPVGVAPDVNLLVARALDANGAGSYADVIAAIDWIVANKARYNVRVLNLSLYAPVTGPYWTDPLNQAVMRAWQAGIVVVVAAGNAGPTAGTITVPGNVPYVITVGAVRSGRYNQSGLDELAAYSSRGPTESAFVKPDVVVPASYTIAPIPQGATLAAQVPSSAIVAVAKVDFKIGAFKDAQQYGQLSGTSMAAAQVSGLAALVIQANAQLSNDEVKYRLLATARPAVDEATGALIYSPWEQGAGLVDAQTAVLGTASGRANTGLDVGLDLAGTSHYWGHTTWDEASGEFRLADPATGAPIAVWNGGGYVWSGGGYVWSGGGYVWSGGGYVWSGGGYVWSGADVWTSTTSLWAGSSRSWAGGTPSYGAGASAGAGLAIEE
jgi:serine protease AprX